jgi:hypothetical protein
MADGRSRTKLKHGFRAKAVCIPMNQQYTGRRENPGLNQCHLRSSESLFLAKYGQAEKACIHLVSILIGGM